MRKIFCFTLIIQIIVFICISSGASCIKQQSYLDEVRLAAKWIRNSAVRTENGITWPAVPGDKSTINNTLYSGTPGTVLFFLEAYYATEDHTFLEDAKAGADYLLATMAEEKGAGLYVGISGIGFSLEETYKVTSEEKYRQGVLVCLERLKEWAQEKENGIHWSETTDLISGNTGTGLFLIYLFRELKDSSILDMAVRVGDYLIDVGIPVEPGIKWAMDPEYPRLMPNFSHGTAGVAYFLASLYKETGEKRFLEAALQGARYLISIAKTDNGICLIFHHEPEGEDLYYLGWCHGPVGTSRLFLRLYEITGDKEWMDWVERGARGILESGIPKKETPGFWNNAGQCCGSAGVADYFLSLYQITKKQEYLDFSKRLTDQILSKATLDDIGMRWVQAEHRSRPDLLLAQTNLMQGAAGIGLWLLHLEEFERGMKPKIVLLDSPFL